MIWSMTKDNNPFLIRPERQLVNRLRQTADLFKRKSANEIAVEVIREYLEFWIEAESAKQTVFGSQKDRLNQMKEAQLRQNLHEAEAEEPAKTAQKRRRR